MEPAEYAAMAAVEDRMWWYRALHRNVLATLAWALPRADATILDAGCGTGGLLRQLARARPAARLVGLDLSARALALAGPRIPACLLAGSANRLPFAAASFDGLLSLDVLYHRAVDPVAALAESRRCLRPGGVAVINLPAYRWLRSAHDARVHGVRRFTEAEARGLLRAAGLRVEWASYWNTIPFPAMAVRRLMSRAAGKSDARLYPRLVEWLLDGAMRLEHAALRRRWRLPFGGSILLVARRHD